jgi:hypothetical protein
MITVRRALDPLCLGVAVRRVGEQCEQPVAEMPDTPSRSRSQIDPG